MLDILLELAVIDLAVRIERRGDRGKNAVKKHGNPQRVEVQSVIIESL
jgi:hypothetical protein